MKNSKFILSFFLFLLLQLNCHAHDLPFNPIQEVLDFETAQIVDLGSADSYINRAESYLLCQKYELALVDLETGYQLSQNRDDNPVLHFRSLFGLAIVYANIDDLDRFHAVVDSIKNFLDAHKCTGCLEKHTDLCSHYEIISEKFLVEIKFDIGSTEQRICIALGKVRPVGTTTEAVVVAASSKACWAWIDAFLASIRLLVVVDVVEEEEEEVE